MYAVRAMLHTLSDRVNPRESASAAVCRCASVLQELYAARMQGYKYLVPGGTFGTRWQQKLGHAFLWALTLGEFGLYLGNLGYAEWNLAPLKDNPLLGLARADYLG